MRAALAWVRIAARECTPQRGGSAKRVAPLEVVEAEGARDQRSVRRAGTYIPLAAAGRATARRTCRAEAEIELDGRSCRACVRAG